MNAVQIENPDPGVHALTWGQGVSAADLAEAFASLPSDAVVGGVDVAFFCEADQCEGSPVEDDDHVSGVLTLLVFDADFHFDPAEHEHEDTEEHAAARLIAAAEQLTLAGMAAIDLVGSECWFCGSTPVEEVPVDSSRSAMVSLCAECVEGKDAVDDGDGESWLIWAQRLALYQSDKLDRGEANEPRDAFESYLSRVAHHWSAKRNSNHKEV